VISINAETATLAGTLTADGKFINVITAKVTSSPGGPCFLGDSGGFSGNFVPPLTGTWTGTLQLQNPAGFLGDVTAMFTEDPNFNVTGSMTITNGPCFSSLATEPDNPGTSIGSITSFEMTDGMNVVDFVGNIQVSLGVPVEYVAHVTVTAGCTEESGLLELSSGIVATVQAPAASRARTAPSAINPVLVERFKALLAARREHESSQ